MKCICCNKSITPIYENLSLEDCVFKIEERRQGNTIHQIQAENRMWLNGVVANISAGFGSSHDGGQFVIAVCDDCLLNKMEEGAIALTGDYISRSEIILERLEKYRIIWRRNNNLDNLIN